ncbi:hypothetical protein ACMXYR_04905 [Neptuniibacter sp. QD29_5]|uniref:hypothetical protein n=1 Tax=Neptuniibacter sp. QD29_5 TaxID=3398207 RepID=UPI0039F57D3E
MLKLLQLNRLLLPIVASVSASVQGAPDVEFNGFITQGYTHTSDNSFYGDSESGSWDFREVAGNASWRLTDRLLLTGQLMSRRAGEVDDGDLTVDYGLLDYRVYEGRRGSFGISVGRIKNPFGFYNKTRDVAFTRPSAVLPQSLYFDKARNLELSSDGFRLYGRYLFDHGILESELVIGEPRKDLNVEYAYLNNNWDGFFHDSSGHLWRTEYSVSDYSFVVAATVGGFKLDFDGPENPDPFTGEPGDGRVEIDLTALSMQYNWKRWSLTGEYFQQDIAWGSLGGAYALIPESTTESFYLQLDHRLTSDVTLFLRRDMLYLDKDDRDGSRTAALFGKPAHTQFAFDWTLGLGWKPNKNWLLRAEWHKVEGTGWLAAQENPNDQEKVEDWDMLMLQATYRF